MDRQIEIAYEGEVHDQAVIAHRAYLRIRSAIELHRTPESERKPPVPDQELVAVLHESVIGFLDACAIIAKFFDPTPRDRSSSDGMRALMRGRHLQHSVEVDLQADAFMSKEVRNAMEHIDERMDEWLAGSPPYFKRTWVVVWSGTDFARRAQGGLRVFTAETMEVSVLGERTNIEQMHEALVSLDQDLESTTKDLHVRVSEPGEAGDSVSIREAIEKRLVAPSVTPSLPPESGGPP
jgi:hypothetical protein